MNDANHAPGPARTPSSPPSASTCPGQTPDTSPSDAQNRPFSPPRPRLARLTGLALMTLARAITGVRSFWMGCAPTPKQQRVYFANHSSHTDFLLLWASLPTTLRQQTRPVAGVDYWHRSGLRRFLIDQVFRGVLVQRHQPADAEASPEARREAAAQALAPLRQALSQGDSLIIFPEGTRNTEDGLLPFKAGLYHLAHEFPDVEFIPVWLDNLNRVMPKGQIIPLPLLCTITFGAPLPLLTEETKTAYLARARQALMHLNPRKES